jgi:hypothetical protein
MSDSIADGTEREIEGRRRVYYDGRWIKWYPMPSDTLLEKRRLIEVLTRRLFNHVEHGLYVPGVRLAEARRAYESETDPARKRVKGGMLAAALFNRATDILTKLVELQTLGVDLSTSSTLMRTCGEHLKEALDLGKLVLHRSGEEGIDELWGEPFKVFAFPVQEFFRSRYVKVAMAMSCIEHVGATLTEALEERPAFAGIAPLIAELTESAKAYSETARSDPDIFDVCASFAVASEKLLGFQVTLERAATSRQTREVDRGLSLVRSGTALMASIARARVPMKASTDTFARACQRYRTHFASDHERDGAPSIRRARPRPAPDTEVRP